MSDKCRIFICSNFYYEVACKRHLWCETIISLFTTLLLLKINAISEYEHNIKITNGEETPIMKIIPAFTAISFDL